MPTPAVESGVSRQEFYFIRETETSSGEPTAPSDPSILLYSSAVNSFEAEGNPNFEARSGVGEWIGQDKTRQQEDNELTINYDLEKFPERIGDPDGSSTLGVQSDDSGDTNITVTITSEDGNTSEDITTDGTDGTTFVTGATSFSTVGTVELGSAASGTITVAVDDSGSPGKTLIDVPAGETTIENAWDAFYDISKRNIDNQVESTHSVLRVEQFDSLASENTVHYRYFTELGNTHPDSDPGATSLATRKETYARGSIPEEGVMTLNPGDSATATIELTYIPTEMRPYQFDQPGSSQQLHVRSSDSGDTDLDVNIETEDGSTSETVSTDSNDGTTVVTSSNSSYDSLRVEVPGSNQGYIEVYTDDGNGNPEYLLAAIPGQDARDGVESDDGVPLVGSGSFETESAAGIGDGIPAALAGDITFATNNAAQYIGELELTISNEVSDQTTSEGLHKFINAGGAEVSLESTVFGETENIDNWKRMLRGTEGEILLPMADGDISMPRAYVDEFGEEVEAGSAVATPETTFKMIEPADGGEPIVYNRA